MTNIALRNDTDQVHVDAMQCHFNVLICMMPYGIVETFVSEDCNRFL